MREPGDASRVAQFKMCPTEIGPKSKLPHYFHSEAKSILIDFLNFHLH